MRNILKTGIVSLVIPFFALAQATNVNAFDILGTITDILAVIIPILLVIATIIFIYGLITYILASGKEENRTEARHIMIWGIVILFVTVAVWGLVTVIENTFGVERENIPSGPQAPVIPGL